MYIIVGLGNPEPRYEFTRHNAGFLALELLAKKHGILVRKSAHKAVIGEGRIGTAKVLLAKPQTYMNNSGQAVVDLINWYKIAPDELIVLYDDVDLDIGTIRVRPSGSAGTHNGMRSIITLTGSDAFARVRIGIGKQKPGWELADHVLSVFPEEEKKPVYDSLQQAAEAVEWIIKEGVDAAQRQFNKKPPKPKPVKPPEADNEDPSRNASKQEDQATPNA
jgi:PTH1 family peptidyl-tRNA hydrolase